MDFGYDASGSKFIMDFRAIGLRRTKVILDFHAIGSRRTKGWQ